MGTYCTATDVSSFLQIPDFSSSTAVTDTQVEALITMKEDYIDAYTRHAWREKTETEYHDLRKYLEWNLGWAMQIALKHRKIKTLDSAQGDSLKIWNGSEWEEWLDNKTEGRNKDYWLDYIDGFLFIRGTYWKRDFAIKIKYRYGEDSVPGDIKEACIKLTAIDLLTSEDRSSIVPDSPAQLNYSGKIEKWKEDVIDILNGRKEFGVASF